jgi:hypothetical protein
MLGVPLILPHREKEVTCRGLAFATFGHSTPFTGLWVTAFFSHRLFEQRRVLDPSRNYVCMA